MKPNEESIGFLVNATGRKMAQLLNTLYSPYGVTTEQWTILRALLSAENMNQKELAKRVSKDQASVTRILDGMQRKRLVQRKANEEDRRSFLIYVTEEGKAIAEKLLPIEEKMLGLVLEGFAEAEIAQLKEMLGRITANVVQAGKGALTDE